jgi:hypothetical protein
MKIKYYLILCLMVIPSYRLKGQLLDGFGFRIGGGLSNHYWNYLDVPDLSYWKDNKYGLSAMINAEIPLYQILSLRPEIGYIQKGFKNDLTSPMAQDIEIDLKGKDVIFHDLSASVGLKVSPFYKILKPYLTIGLRADYLLKYKDVTYEFEGHEYGLYEDDGNILNDINKLTLSVLMGIGIEYNERYYLDFELNPALTNNYSDKALNISDRFIGLTLGVNIKNLIKKDKE